MGNDFTNKEREAWEEYTKGCKEIALKTSEFSWKCILGCIISVCIVLATICIGFIVIVFSCNTTDTYNETKSISRSVEGNTTKY